jgi:hypothetical protein
MASLFRRGLGGTTIIGVGVGGQTEDHS